MGHTSLEQGVVQNEGPLKIPVSERRGLNLIHPCQGCCNSQLYLGQLNRLTRHNTGRTQKAASCSQMVWKSEEGRRQGTHRESDGRDGGQVIMEVAGGEEN